MKKESDKVVNVANLGQSLAAKWFSIPRYIRYLVIIGSLNFLVYILNKNV